MSEQFGNVLPAPSFSQVDEVKPAEILFSTVGLTQKGVTLASGQGVLKAGYPLGRVTATKKWKLYSNGASDGTEVCRGILRQDVDTSTAEAVAAGGILANIVVAGMLRDSKLSGVDANAITDLNARQDPVLDIFQF